MGVIVSKLHAAITSGVMGRWKGPLESARRPPPSCLRRAALFRLLGGRASCGAGGGGGGGAALEARTLELLE